MNSRAMRTAVLLFTLATPLVAHHSVAATYDSSKVMTITGTVTEEKWMNPHTWLSIDVMGADGKIVAWKVEIGSINNLFRAGFRKESVAISSSVTMQVWPARDGSLVAAGRVLTLPDGKQFDVHDSFGENLQKK